MQQEQRSGATTPPDFTAHPTDERKQISKLPYPDFMEVYDRYEAETAYTGCAAGVMTTLAKMAEELQYTVDLDTDLADSYFSLEATNASFSVTVEFDTDCYYLETYSERTDEVCFKHESDDCDFDIGVAVRQLIYCAWMVNNAEQKQ